MTALETYFLENKVFYCNALAYNGQNSLQQYMFDYLCSIFAQNARELNPEIPSDQAQMAGQFFAGAMMGILIPWVFGGMKSNALSSVSDISLPVFNHDIMRPRIRFYHRCGAAFCHFLRLVQPSCSGKLSPSASTEPKVICSEMCSLR